MKAFIVMPFAGEFKGVFAAMKDACARADVDYVRADEIDKPGPIINQIFESVSSADCIIAEVSSKNPNVYYEIGLVHCVEKPTILVARSDKISELPFDIRHNRVIAFDPNDPSSLVAPLRNALNVVKDTNVRADVIPTLANYLESLAPSKHGAAIEWLMEQIKIVAAKFEMTNARLVEEKWDPQKGFTIIIEDDFKDKVVFTIDVNGIIRREKKIS
jgi:hypothetical protein